MTDVNERVKSRYIIAIIMLLVLFYAQLISGWSERIEYLQSISQEEK
jgi:hypothetical protein